MLQEKDLVNDILSGTKASLNCYATFIAETSDQNLRQTLQQMRNGDEAFQYELYKIANQKGYYKPAPAANPNDMSQLKSQLSSSMTV